MSTAPFTLRFHFHGNLVDFISHRKSEAERVCTGLVSLKDAVESLGIPHPEVGALMSEGHTMQIDQVLGEDADVDVYPFGHPCEADWRPLHPAEGLRFILDVHCGVLARMMRMLGLDVLYESEDLGDPRIAEIAHAEQRIVLTRDIGLLKRSLVDYGYWLRSRDSKEQFREVVNRYGITQAGCSPFTRCIQCNHVLVDVDKQSVWHQLPENVRNIYDTFRSCRPCDKVYWKGTHYVSMAAMLENMLG